MLVKAQELFKIKFMQDQRSNLNKIEIEKFKKAADGFVQIARERVLKHYLNRSFTVELKSDISPVTEADLEAERILRESISKSFPDHGIIGEEYPPTNPGSEFQWTIDPIDGTQNFAAGIPTFGIMLSLRFQNKPIVGIIDHPALNLNYSSGFGLGTFCNNEKVLIKDSNASALGPEHIVIISTKGMFQRTNEGHLMDEFIKTHYTNRIYYDCFGHSLAASGCADAMVEFNVRIWDASPTELLVTEAGGVFKYIRAQPSVDPDKYTNFLSAIFGKPSIVKLLEPRFS